MVKIASTLKKKLNKKYIEIDDIVNEIENYNPLIGKKLITSGIIHGYDKQRSQIVDSIEKFLNKAISKELIYCADILKLRQCSINCPQKGNKFAFIILYKTVKGTVFGSYSEGMKKPTFIFSFNSFT